MVSWLLDELAPVPAHTTSYMLRILMKSTTHLDNRGCYQLLSLLYTAYVVVLRFPGVNGGGLLSCIQSTIFHARRASAFFTGLLHLS